MRNTSRVLKLVVSTLTGASLAVSGLVLAAAPAQAAEGSVTIEGSGFGHGRGLGQWGSYGYAVDRGWSYRQILDHYYGGTRLAADAGNPEVSVELLASRGRDAIVTGRGLVVDGTNPGAPAVLFRRVAPGQFQVFTGPGCGGPWSSWGPVRTSGTTARTTADPGNPENYLAVCEGGQKRAYRGALSVLEGAGRQALVNRVPINEYLRGVVPRESPASWGSAGGGRGMEALKAQAVAARSYALSSAWTSYAQTCDTTSCQVYGGAYVQSDSGTRTTSEDARTDRAVAETSDQVRRLPNGRIVRTEFSASTGGWTVGGDFPAVEDLGDATAANPNRAWSAAFGWDQLGARLGTAPVTGMVVTRRNGLGARGGRVLEVAVDTTSGRRLFSGNQVRVALGLRSDWFSVIGLTQREAQALTTALYVDVLGRAPDPGGLAGWSGALTTGTPVSSVATSLATSTERYNGMVDGLYRRALVRGVDPGGRDTWVGQLARGATVTDLETALYSSPESLAVLGRGDVRLWVDGAYRGMLGRGAGEAERTYWAERVNERGRAAVARDISVSAEARTRRLNRIYVAMLGRPGDPGGLAHFLPAMLGRGEFSVVVTMGGSPEYAQRALRRF